MRNLKLLLAVFLLIFVADAIKINHPRVLLPIFDKISVNFTLEVKEKGCFRWTSSRQDLILITALDGNADDVDCTYRAKVTVLTRERRRNTAIVLAEDVTTGQTLRCDVILDIIHRMTVHTTTRQLYLEEAPAVFELRAEDSQGNEFTTLEGIEFKWTISPLNGDSAGWLPPLRFLSFTDSEYHEVPSALTYFETKGIKGYMVLLEGVRTGTAKLSVTLPHREYKNVLQLDVYINVLANIIIEPSEVCILPGDTVNFRIYQLHMGKIQEITTNKQYYLEIEDNTVATLIGNAATGNKYGTTTVLLFDSNVPQDDESMQKSAAAMPSAELTVVEPFKLGISLLPHNNWITVVGEKHEIALDLYTRNEQKITLGSRYAMSARLDESLFEVLKRNQNGSRLYGQTVQEGSTYVFGTFNDLAAEAELQIYPGLKLKPLKVLLPYDPNNIIKMQKIQFHASGGDGSYSWHSQNPRVLHVNQSGMASTVLQASDSKLTFDASESTQPVYVTHASIKVALARNSHITRVARVYFLPPVKLQIIKYNFETALKDFVHLHVAIYAYSNNSLQPLTHCDNLLFDYEFSNQIFQLDHDYNYPTTPAAGACQVLHLRSTALGLTHFRLSYNYQDKLLHDEVTLSVFERLHVIYPNQQELVLPIGASMNVIYGDGPQRIFTLETELTRSMLYDRSLVAVAEMHSAAPVHVLNVLCRKVGETVLDFNIFNALLADNFEAYVSSIDIMVRCVKPRFLNLYALQELRDSCPTDIKNSLLHLRERDDKFEVQIEVQDVKNRVLMNITSLHMEWEFTGGVEERYHTDVVNYQRLAEDRYLHGIRIGGKNLLITSLSKPVKAFHIKGIVTHYEARVLQQQDIRAEEPNFGIKNPKTGIEYTPIIENEINFMAVNTTTVFATDQYSIFMARNTLEHIPILQGSGYYDFTVTEPGVIHVEYDAKKRELIVKPLGIGHTRIELVDQCLVTAPAYLSVSVVAIGQIDIITPDRVERTKSIEAIVKLYDSNDNALHIDAKNLALYELSEIVSQHEVLSLKLGDQSDLGLGEIRYIITGNKLGEAKVAFTSGSNENNLVTSNIVNILVFPPLRLLPRNSTLIIGSSLQIMHQGGPQPDLNIAYDVHDKKIITMDSAIVTGHTLGITKITGRCMMNNPVSGKQIIISQDTVEVNVVPLVSIQVKTPLVRLRVGAVMPATLWGTPDLSPMVLGTMQNMRIHWTTNRPGVVEIYNVFASAGIEYQDSDMITARIKARNPGKTKLTASIELPNGQRMSSSVEVIVFKILELMAPKSIKMDWILAAPQSTMQLKSNMDDVVYANDKDSSGIIKVTPDGLVRTFETLGRDLIIAKTFEQSLPIGIEVKNVQYILASLEPSTIKLKQIEEKLPIGINVVLKVLLYDNQGNEFSHNIEDINNGLKYDLSHKDVVDVKIGNNMSMTINFPCETNSMIAIGLKDAAGVKYAEDYIKLAVAESEHVYPTKAIFVPGDIICFDSPLILSAPWSSSDEKIISIDRNTGIARVLNTRSKLAEKVVVANGDRVSGTYIKYDVEVRDADVIQAVKTFDIFSGTTYRGHLVIRNHLQTDKISNLIARNVTKCAPLLLAEKTPLKLLTCKLTSKQPLGEQLLKHYKVTPVFDAEVGQYACQIDLTSNFNEVLGIVKTNDVHFELQSQLLNGLLESISLKLVPGIKVSPDAIHAGDVTKQELIVTGLDKVLQKVEVKSSDKQNVQVHQQARAHGTLQYKINVINDLPRDEELFITVHSPVTLQDIQIPIVSSNSLQAECTDGWFAGSFSLTKFLSNLGLIVTMLAVLFSTVWVYLHWGAQRSPEINTAVFATSSPNQNRTASPTGFGMPTSPFATSGYQNISPYYKSSPASPVYKLDNSQDSQVYGDTTIISPQKRMNRRYL